MTFDPLDIYRPPAPLGPRVPLWAKLAILWGASFGVYLLLLILSANSTPNLSFALVISIVALAASLVMVYAQLRLGVGTIGMSYAWAPSYLSVRGFPYGETTDSARLSDAEERSALHRLRRGAITRREYERIIARRHFAHGEISRAEYHKILEEIGSDDPPHPEADRHPSGSHGPVE